MNYLVKFIKSNRKLHQALRRIYVPIISLKHWKRKKLRNSYIQSYITINKLAKELNINVLFKEDNIFILTKDGRKFYYYPERVKSLLLVPILGNYENNESNFVSNIVQKGDTTIDIGANFGWYTTLLANKVGEQGRVYAFEPIIDTFKELENNILLNSLEKTVVLNNMAVGETNGTIKMFVPNELGSAWASMNKHGNDNCSEFECQIIMLDKYIKENNLKSIKLIKCDVEGAELFVLKGANELISSDNPPIWIMEVSEVWTYDFGYKPNELFDFMENKGYKIFYLHEGKLINIKKNQIKSVYNFVFLKSEEHITLLHDYF